MTRDIVIWGKKIDLAVISGTGYVYRKCRFTAKKLKITSTGKNFIDCTFDCKKVKIINPDNFFHDCKFNKIYFSGSMCKVESSDEAFFADKFSGCEAKQLHLSELGWHYMPRPWRRDNNFLGIKKLKKIVFHIRDLDRKNAVDGLLRLAEKYRCNSHKKLEIKKKNLG